MEMTETKEIWEIDFDKLKWKKAYEGVYTSCLYQSPETTPIISCHAVRILPNSKIGLHYHKREPCWRETLIFPHGGDFEFIIEGESHPFNTGKLVLLPPIRPRQVYGIRNRSTDKNLDFLVITVPPFTEMGEIVKVE